jgi:flavorubredoxin
MKCLLLLLAAVASAQQPPTRILVAYHSESGNTEKLAQAVGAGAKSVEGVTVTPSMDLAPEATDSASFSVLPVSEW